MLPTARIANEKSLAPVPDAATPYAIRVPSGENSGWPLRPSVVTGRGGPPPPTSTTVPSAAPDPRTAAYRGPVHAPDDGDDEDDDPESQPVSAIPRTTATVGTSR
ncbi:MAG: hypothetical protein ACXVLZ_14450 [Acidimicrobiia bacterium]